jgi:hypothetical protein
MDMPPRSGRRCGWPATAFPTAPQLLARPAAAHSPHRCRGSPSVLEGTTARPKHSAPLVPVQPYALLRWFPFPCAALLCCPPLARAPLCRLRRGPVQRTAGVEGALSMSPRRPRQKHNEGRKGEGLCCVRAAGLSLRGTRPDPNGGLLACAVLFFFPSALPSTHRCGRQRTGERD